MSREQYLERAELCFDMACGSDVMTVNSTNLHRASWLWLFCWAGMLL